MTTVEGLRCVACRRLLAEVISSPFRLRCRCGALHVADETGQRADTSKVKARYQVRFDI